MAFENLSDKLQNVFRNLRGKGRLSDADVKAALKEVKLALLEADVNFKVVKDFVKSVEARAIGTDVLNGLNPAQTVIKIVNEEMVSLMGAENTELSFKPGSDITVIMMLGLQGAGKTTTAAKLASRIKSMGRSPLLVACDVYRPAAIEQLEINAKRVEVPCFSLGDKEKPAVIAKKAVEYAKANGCRTVLLDTAGRLQIDEAMMDELREIRSTVEVHQSILVVDAMTGQEAVNVADTFSKEIGIDGVILTKLDGDARGGAALSIRAVTDKPILFVGMGEKLSELEPFHPDRMASRILGMGDVLTLIEKAQEAVDDEDAKKLARKVKKADFDFNDYLMSVSQMNKMGGIGSVMKMMPGMGGMLPGNSKMPDIDEDETAAQMKRIASIIYSMTPAERANPKLVSPSRKKRIASGAGVDISEVNRLYKQQEQMKKMMKQLPGMMGGKFGRRGMRFPF